MFHEDDSMEVGSFAYGSVAAAPIQRICVFCGARLGTNPAFASAAEELGRAAAHAGLGVVYGG
jgi:predicted Rossmann-fold nucleotide-binding protein